MTLKCFLATLFSLLFLLPTTLWAQTWVDNWTAANNGLTTSVGGAALTVDDGGGTIWVGATGEALDSGALDSETASFSEIKSSNATVLTFSLPSGFVFNEFKMVDLLGDSTGLVSTLGSGTWSIQESAPGTVQSAFIDTADTALHHFGEFIAIADVDGLNSFAISINDQMENSSIGFAYSVTAVPEPQIAMLLGLAGLMIIMRRRS